MRRLVLRAGALLAATLAGAVAALGLAAPAAAHVTVEPGSATQGGYTKLTFRVPNEKETASTVGLEINIPGDTAIASVSVKPTAGWTAAVTRSTLATPIQAHDRQITEAVTKIVWTASGGAEIKPGEFQEFEVSAGPLPHAERIIFKTLQVYSDGDIVRWIDEPRSDEVELEHPAPVLRLVEGADDHGEEAGTSSGRDEAGATAGADDDRGGADDDRGGADGAFGLALGAVGAGLGLAGLVVGLLADRRAGAASPPRSGP